MPGTLVRKNIYSPEFGAQSYAYKTFSCLVKNEADEIASVRFPDSERGRNELTFQVLGYYLSQNILLEIFLSSLR